MPKHEDENNGIVLNMNGLSRADYNAWLADRKVEQLAAEKKGIRFDSDTFDAERLIIKIVEAWPFKQPISVKGYLALGLKDSVTVDNTIQAAMEDLNKKK